jgi:hypothetical protein
MALAALSWQTGYGRTETEAIGWRTIIVGLGDQAQEPHMVTPNDLHGSHRSYDDAPWQDRRGPTESGC